MSDNLNMPFVFPFYKIDQKIVPYSLWTWLGLPFEKKLEGNFPNFKEWLRHMHRISVNYEAPHEPLPTSLSMPHEVAQATALAWDFPDGCVPWAANAAAEQHLSADTSAWAFVTLCNWHVSNGHAPRATCIDNRPEGTSAALSCEIRMKTRVQKRSRWSGS